MVRLELAPRIARAAVLLALAPIAPALQSDQGVIDTLESIGAIGVDTRNGSRVVVGSPNRLGEVPRLTVFDGAAGSVDFARTDVIQPPAFQPTWYVLGVAIDGDLIAHPVRKHYDPTQELFVHERVGGEWLTSSILLPGPRWLQFGDMTAVHGDRIVTLTARSLNRRIRLQIVERDPAGGWMLVDTVVTDLRAPWFEYPTEVVLEGDVAAVRTSLGNGLGDVVICEPDSTGAWSESATLPSPETDAWTVEAMCLENGVLAVVRAPLSGGQPDAVLHLYERLPSNGWRVTGRATLDRGAVAFPPWDVEIDGDRVAVSNFDRTVVLVRDPQGGLTVEHSVERAPRAVGFDDGRLIAAGFPATIVIDVPRATGATTAARLRGLETCAGTGAARLRVHDVGVTGSPTRRAAAEIVDAPPGAAAFVLRSVDPGFAPALGGLLCIDRTSSVRVGPPRAIDADGRATFTLDAGSGYGVMGFDAADHLQGVVLGATAELTNSIAWLP